MVLFCLATTVCIVEQKKEKKTKATTQDSCIYDLGFRMYLLFLSGNYRLHLVSSGDARTYIWACSWYLRDGPVILSPDFAIGGFVCVTLSCTRLEDLTQKESPINV